MAKLRAPDGCPWDREQNLQSLKPYLIEEAYEVLDAIDRGIATEHCEELGDVLLQIVFQSQIASENDWFDANDVVDTLCQKLIRRHPHVFGDEKAKTPEEVIKHWERIKKEEKADSETEKKIPSALDGIPGSFPPMMAASILSKRAARKGFDWTSYGQVWEKVQEELQELHEAIELEESEPGRQDEIEWELGDVFFALVNLARHLDLDPSESLRKANGRFSERFRSVEKMASQKGIEISKADLDTLEQLWQEAKIMLKHQQK